MSAGKVGYPPNPMIMLILCFSMIFIDFRIARTVLMGNNKISLRFLEILGES